MDQVTLHAGTTLHPADPPKVTWKAGRGGIGHAYPLRGRSVAACGADPIEDRFTWPVDFRCVDCRVALQEQTDAPPDGEQRRLWGDR